MSTGSEDNIERFFRKAVPGGKDADTSFQEEDWRKMERMLDEEASRRAAARVKKLKVAGGLGAGLLLIFSAVFFLARNESIIATETPSADAVTEMQKQEAVVEDRAPSQTEDAKVGVHASEPNDDKVSRNEEEGDGISGEGRGSASSGSHERPEPVSGVTNESTQHITPKERETRDGYKQSHVQPESTRSITALHDEAGKKILTSTAKENIGVSKDADGSEMKETAGKTVSGEMEHPVAGDPSKEGDNVPVQKDDDLNGQKALEDHIVGFNDLPGSATDAASSQQKNASNTVSSREEEVALKGEEEEEEISNELDDNQESRRRGDTTILHDKNWPTSNWSFALVAAPDFSRTGLSRYTTPGSAVGLLVQYQLGKRLIVASGFIRTNKIYWGFGREYHPPEGYWNNKTNGIMPERVDGTCMVLEVPLTIRYNLMEVEKNLLYASAGISSYLMQDENYRYTFENPNPGAASGWKSKGGVSPYWFGVGSFSIGYERMINQRVSLGLEPYLKVPFAGVGWANLSIYSAGVYVNLRYRLLRPGSDRPPPVESR